jgi:hypothetical protein
MTPRQIIQARNDGLLTDDETQQLLDEQQVRGGFDGPAYTGYDYRHQEWIVVES